MGDPILDFLNVKGKKLGYVPDYELPGFNENLLLSKYIEKFKKQFIEKIRSSLSDDLINLTNDSFIVKTKNLHKYFKNHENFIGSGYSLFTVEFSSISIGKFGNTLNSGSQKYYNFKNWYLKKNCIKNNSPLDFSFIIGRKYTNSKGVVSDSYDYLAENKTDCETLLKECEDHFKNLNSYQIGISIFPNMKNKSDYPWHNVKKTIANDIKEITLVSNCSVKNRNDMINSDICSYENLSIPLVENKKPIVNTECLPLPENENILFIDFEMVTPIYEDFSKFPSSNDKSFIFDIGVGYEKGCSFEFESFVAKDLKDEYKIIKNFINFLNNFPGESLMLVHWTDVEKRLFKQVLSFYCLNVDKKIIWFDLHDYFKKSKVYVKDSLNYKLKSVCRSLYENGLIKSKWENSFADGLGAMTGYLHYLETGEEKFLTEIVNYNMIDCKVLWEIYNLLKCPIY